jgi:hypothetical protein
MARTVAASTALQQTVSNNFTGNPLAEESMLSHTSLKLDLFTLQNELTVS